MSVVEITATLPCPELLCQLELACFLVYRMICPHELCQLSLTSEIVNIVNESQLAAVVFMLQIECSFLMLKSHQFVFFWVKIPQKC